MQLQNLLELNTQVLVWMLCVVSMIVFAAPQLVTTCTEDADLMKVRFLKGWRDKQKTCNSRSINTDNFPALLIHAYVQFQDKFFCRSARGKYWTEPKGLFHFLHTIADFYLDRSYQLNRMLVQYDKIFINIQVWRL